MKPLLLALFLPIVLCSSSWATDEKTIEASQAAQYVGVSVVVHVNTLNKSVDHYTNAGS